MSSVKNRYSIEEYVNGGWGCPDMDIMGCSTFDELVECMEANMIVDTNCTKNEPNCRDCGDSGKILVHDPTYENDDNHREENCPYCTKDDAEEGI